MSSNAAVAPSEGINRISGGDGFHIGFKPVPVHHVHARIEQRGDVILQPSIVENGDPGAGIELDRDVGVASRTFIATRPRTEQSGMTAWRCRAPIG